MKKLILLLLPLMLAFSCTEKEQSLSIEEKQEVSEYLAEADVMSREIDLIDYTPLLDFIEVATTECDLNTSEVAPINIQHFLEASGFLNFVEIHDWVVDFGMLLIRLVEDPYADYATVNAEIDHIIQVSLAHAGANETSHPLHYYTKDCSTESLNNFAYQSLIKANNYGVRIANATRECTGPCLTGYGSAFHRFLNMNVNLIDCRR